MVGIAGSGGRFVVGIALFHEELRVANAQQIISPVNVTSKATGCRSR
jgi:hypothetical protein